MCVEIQPHRGGEWRGAKKTQLAKKKMILVGGRVSSGGGEFPGPQDAYCNTSNTLVFPQVVVRKRKHPSPAPLGEQCTRLSYTRGSNIAC